MHTSHAVIRCSFQAKYVGKPKQPNLTNQTLFRLYWPLLLMHSFWVLCEVAIR